MLFGFMSQSWGYYCSVPLQVRFLSDLVNCHVLVAASVLQMFDNFVEVTLEDNIPQVCRPQTLHNHEE